MQITPIIATAIALFLPATLDAHAASSDWHHVDGASIRLVTSGMPDEDGRLRGALEIRLKPGWKTYWRDPGSSGVPPTLDATIGGRQATVDIGFPEPQRFDDGYSPWAGYDHALSLALTFHAPSGGTANAPVEANAFLGVCETICIPVQARLRLEPTSDAQSPDDEMIVDSAFQALPRPAEPDLRAETVQFDGTSLTIEADAPEGVEVLDIFVAGTETLTLGTPDRLDRGERPTFVVPVRGKTGPEAGLAYTLVTNAGAVSGHLRIP